VIGVGQYAIDEGTHTAEVGFAVKDDYQNSGIGWELLSYLTFLARNEVFLASLQRSLSKTDRCSTSLINWGLTLKGDVRKGSMNSRSCSGKRNSKWF